MSDHETEEGSTDPLDMKRTSKHQKKLAVPFAEHCPVLVAPPLASYRDVLVADVNAGKIAHRRDVAEDEERKR